MFLNLLLDLLHHHHHVLLCDLMSLQTNMLLFLNYNLPTTNMDRLPGGKRTEGEVRDGSNRCLHGEMNSRHNRSSNRMRKKKNVKDGIKTGNYYRDS